MKHKLKFLALITALTISLSGCYPTGEKELPSNSSGGVSDVQGNSEASQPFAGKVSEKFGDVELNYEISSNFPTQLPKIRLRRKNFDTELCKSVLLRDKTILPQRKDQVDWVFYTTDNCELSVGGDRLEFYDNNILYTPKHYQLVAMLFNKFCQAGNAQLNSFSSAEAIEQINEIFDELGIENYTEPYVVTVTPEDANALLEPLIAHNDEGEYALWEEDDGFYILKYRFSYNGIDLCTDNLKTPGTSREVKGSEIMVCVSKEGVFMIDTNTGLYDVISLDEGTVDLKYDAKYASDQLVKHYSKITNVKYPTSFTECKPEYIPLEWVDTREAVFIPAWCFMGYALMDDDGFMRTDYAEYYYADTGRSYGGY